MRIHALSFLVVLAGCVRSQAPDGALASKASGDDAAASEPSFAQLDATLPAEMDASGVDASDVEASGDGGFLPFSPDGQVPEHHRVSGSVCPARPPGTSCPDAGIPLAGRPCVVDGDCTMGADGRCFVYPSLVPPESGSGQGTLYCGSFCSYDACQSDSDCPARVPCECQAAGLAGNPNTCLTQSNCAVDSDCGPGGFCSLSGASTLIAGQPDQAYFCHTAADTCFDDSDCPPPTSPGSDYCMYDPAVGHWDCHYVPTMQ
jgi:hypothetical protein